MGNSFTKNIYDITTLKEELQVLENENKALLEKLQFKEDVTNKKINSLNIKNENIQEDLLRSRKDLNELKEKHIQINYKHDLYKAMNSDLTRMKEELENEYKLLNIKHSNLIKSFKNQKIVTDFLKENNKNILDDEFEKEYLLKFQNYLSKNI